MASNAPYSSILSGRAQREILTSWEWYEERQRGLGDRFIEEVLNKINTIERNPDAFSIKHKSYREAALAVFPVVVIYRVNKRQKSIKVVAIFHTARNYKNKY